MEETRGCEFCGQEFIARRIDSRFCSISCRDKQHYRQNHVPKPIPDTKFTCIVCGKEFKAKSNRSAWRLKYCSPECRQVPNSIYKKETYVPKVPRKMPKARLCESCGEMFYPDVMHPDSKTCSSKCYHNVYQAKQKATRDAKREAILSQGKDCPICGESFIPKTQNQIYCSAKCRRKSIAQTAKEKETPEVKERKKESNFRKRLEGNYAKVLVRDNGTCQFCGSIKNPQVHHLNGLGEARLPDGTRKRYSCDHSLNNLIALCSGCHRAMHNNLLVKHKGKWYIKGSMFKKLGLTGSIEILDD